jgi:hypothetical protein
MKSREIKVQLNKATRSDAEPSPRKTEDKEPEWVSKRKSVTINAPVKIEKDIVFKEGKRRNTIESKLKLNRDSAVLKFRYLEDFLWVWLWIQNKLGNQIANLIKSWRFTKLPRVYLLDDLFFDSCTKFKLLAMACWLILKYLSFLIIETITIIINCIQNETSLLLGLKISS